MKKVKLIYNPNSGDKSIINKLDLIISIYQKNKFTLELYRLDKNSCIDDAIYNIDKNYHHILVSGGDGTIDILLNSMKKNNKDIPVGILPFGTANDFAKALNLSHDIN